MRDIGYVWQHHDQGQDPDQGQHHMHGEPLPVWLDECLVSVNTEGKETEHDGIAGKVLIYGLDTDEDDDKDYLDHGKDKAEELAKEPVVDEQDKE